MADDDKDLKDNRFSYLLQPIRDLAANWDINIAGELEEYLEELENLTFTIEGCGPALNFAEAALLIQGTTCVFSKKVEYLHNLVYQALETIFNKKQKEKQAAANKDKGGRRAAGGNDGLDDAEAFFDLNNLLEIAVDSEINLDDDDETAPPELVRPPTALLALEDAASGQGGQQGNPGEVGSYRLAQCSVHISGALLLESKDGELFDAHLRMLRRGAAAAGSQAVMGDILAGLKPFSQPAALGTAGVSGFDGAAGGPAAEGQYDGDTGHDGFYDDGHDYGAAAGEHDVAAADSVAAGQPDQTLAAVAGDGLDHDMADAQHEPGEQLQHEGEAPDWLSQPAANLDGTQGPEAAADTAAGATGTGAAAVAADDPAAAAEAGPAGRVRQQRSRGKQAAANNAAGEGSYYDPYVPLDPSEPGNLPIKPLQVRKPKRRTVVAASQETAAGSIACLNSSYHPQLHWPEFGYLLDKIAAAATAARKKGRGKQQQQQVELPPGLQRVGPEVAPVLDWQDAAAAEQREQEALLQDDADAGDFGNDGYEDDYSPNADMLGDMDALDAAGQEAAGALRPWATGAVGMHDWMGDGAAAADGEMTYEELCRSHIESLIAAAAAQQVQSELAVRVSGWRARIDPILAAEEDRSAFDIHDYGTKILDRLVDVTETKEQEQQQQQQQSDAAEIVDFKQVAAAQDSFEVCRLFAAMLQLVNNRNVNLVKQAYSEDQDQADDDAGQTCSNLQLQLLTVARVHEAMAEGLAGGPGEQGLQPADGQLEAPPPRRKAGGKKAKKGAASAAAAEDSDPEHTAAKAKGKKAAAAGGKGSKKGRKQKPGRESSSDGEDGIISDLTDSDADVALEESPGAVGRAAVAAAGRSKAAAVGGRGKAKGGKAAAVSVGDGHANSSDEEFDADAENQYAKPAAAAAKKSSRPPAKRAKQAAVSAVA